MHVQRSDDYGRRKKRGDSKRSEDDGRRKKRGDSKRSDDDGRRKKRGDSKRSDDDGRRRSDRLHRSAERSREELLFPLAHALDPAFLSRRLSRHGALHEVVEPGDAAVLVHAFAAPDVEPGDHAVPVVHHLAVRIVRFRKVIVGHHDDDERLKVSKKV